jgi:hypothetical protein
VTDSLHQAAAPPAQHALTASFDHLVYATPDVDRTVRDLARLTGVQPVEGGRHPGAGTRNYLLGLDTGYLEILGPDPEQAPPPGPRPLGVDSLDAPRLVGWAVRVDDIAAQVARARALGYDPGTVRSSSRRTPDGAVLRWQLTDRYDPVVPFLIDWGTSPHPARDLPAVPLLAFHGRHPDPPERQRRLRAIGAGLDVRSGAPGLLAVIADEIVLT